MQSTPLLLRHILERLFGVCLAFYRTSYTVNHAGVQGSFRMGSCELC